MLHIMFEIRLRSKWTGKKLDWVLNVVPCYRYALELPSDYDIAGETCSSLSHRVMLSLKVQPLFVYSSIIKTAISSQHQKKSFPDSSNI